MNNPDDKNDSECSLSELQEHFNALVLLEDRATKSIISAQELQGRARKRKLAVLSEIERRIIQTKTLEAAPTGEGAGEVGK